LPRICSEKLGPNSKHHQEGELFMAVRPAGRRPSRRQAGSAWWDPAGISTCKHRWPPTRRRRARAGTPPFFTELITQCSATADPHSSFSFVPTCAVRFLLHPHPRHRCRRRRRVSRWSSLGTRRDPRANGSCRPLGAVGACEFKAVIDVINYDHASGSEKPSATGSHYADRSGPEHNDGVA
jgi:hypothetical protein